MYRLRSCQLWAAPVCTETKPSEACRRLPRQQCVKAKPSHTHDNRHLPSSVERCMWAVPRCNLTDLVFTLYWFSKRRETHCNKWRYVTFWKLTLNSPLEIFEKLSIFFGPIADRSFDFGSVDFPGDISSLKLHFPTLVNSVSKGLSYLSVVLQSDSSLLYVSPFGIIVTCWSLLVFS